MTINRYCSSGLQAIAIAANRVIAEGVPIAVAGGVESVSLVLKNANQAHVKSDWLAEHELNEAFASQVLYCRDRIGIAPEKLNVNGGAIAIGHPFGMSGARMVGLAGRREALCL